MHCGSGPRDFVHGRGIMNRTCLASRHDSVLVKRSRFGSSSDWRLATVYGSPKFWIGAGSLHVLRLNWYGGNVPGVGGGLLFGPRALVDAAVSAVVADAGDVGVIDHRRVVHVVNDGDVDVVHGTIVEKASAVPTATFIAVAEVAVPIVDSAIETHDRSPEAFIEDESAASPTPISWSPQETDFGSQHPGSRHPVVIAVVGIVGPVTGRPDIALGGADRLFVHGQIGRRERDRDAHADLCGR